MALTYQAAVEQTITAGEQIHQIVNGTATTEVTVEDGSKVPSVRKALLDNFYFKDPIAWQVGQTESVFNQLRKFTDGSWWYAPSATASNPISMGATPVGNNNWKVYSLDAVVKLTPQLRESLRRSYADAGYNLVDGSFEAGGTLVNANDVLLQERTGKAFSGPAGNVAAGTNPASGRFVDRSYVVVMHFPALASIASSGINFSLGSKIVTAGYYSIGDGGGGSYIVTVPSATSVDVGSYSFELVDGFDIRKFGIVDDRELVLDQQAKFAKMIAYANLHKTPEVDFHGFHFKNPLVYYMTTQRGSVLRGIWFTHAVHVKNVGMLKNPDFIANLEAGLCCIGVDLRGYDKNLPQYVSFDNCTFDAFVDYTTYTTVGEADGFCVGITVMQDRNSADGVGLWCGLRTTFTNIHFKTPANSYNIMAPNGYSSHQENLTGEYLGCYVFADSRFSSGSNITGVLRDDLVRGRILVKNLVHFEVESGTFTPEYSLIDYQELSSSAKTSGVDTSSIKMSPVSPVVIDLIKTTNCDSVFIFGRYRASSTIRKARVVGSDKGALFTDWGLIEDIVISNSLSTIGNFDGCTCTSVKIRDSVCKPFDAGVLNKISITDLELRGCAITNAEYGISRGSKLSATNISLYDCSAAGVLLGAYFEKLTIHRLAILGSCVWAVNLSLCTAVDITMSAVDFVDFPYGSFFISSPSDVGGSTFRTCGISSKTTVGLGIPAGAVINGGLQETAEAVLPTKSPYNIGTASRKFNELFLTNGTINTSDEREKLFVDVSDIEREAAIAIAKTIRGFKWVDAIGLKGESAARVHFGVGAQTVIDILHSKGLEPFNYSFVCADAVATDPVTGVSEVIYGIRYTELAMFILAGMLS